MKREVIEVAVNMAVVSESTHGILQEALEKGEVLCGGKERAGEALGPPQSPPRCFLSPGPGPSCPLQLRDSGLGFVPSFLFHGMNVSMKPNLLFLTVVCL